MPKISVLMPIYKTNPEYLRIAIESILKQIYDDFEFLILDDCPDDTRENIVNKYQDKRIKYLRNEKNLGISESRNKLIELSQGQYLTVMDHDDISLPARLAEEASILDTHSEIGVVGTGIHKIVADKDIIQPEQDKDIKLDLMMKCVVTHPSAMIRKSVLIENNIRYEADYSPAEDYKLWCRLIEVTDFYNIPKVLLHYRDWAHNTTNSSQGKMEKATLEIWAENKVKYPELWEKFNLLHSKKINIIRLFNCIPFLKIIEKGRRKKVLLFGCIPLISIKRSVKYD